MSAKTANFYINDDEIVTGTPDDDTYTNLGEHLMPSKNTPHRVFVLDNLDEIACIRDFGTLDEVSAFIDGIDLAGRDVYSCYCFDLSV